MKQFWQPPPPVEEGIWPPVWKASIEECRQYKNGILFPYIRLRSDLLKKYEHRQVNRRPPYYDRLLGFLNQVIDSRCYDYDDRPPEIGKGFPLRVPSDVEMNSELSKENLESKLKFVVAKINEYAEMHGEYYEFHSFVKLVDAIHNRTTFLTMKVMKNDGSNMNGGGELKTVQATVFGHRLYLLIEWRFKPSPT